MVLTIPSYEQAEQRAVQRLPNRVVEAFGPYHFTKVGYPTRITAATEMYKYADAMHEGELEDHVASLGGLTGEEWGHIRDLTAQVWRFSSGDGWPVLPRAALLRGIHSLRQLRALFGDQRPRILELGPGSGYLGALLVRLGYPYAAMDNAQGFYLYQNRLWNEVSQGQVEELADPALELDATLAGLAPGRPVHIPWWRFVTLGPATAHRFDVVICNRVLCEMHPTSLNVNLRLARAFLAGERQARKLFFFDGWGADVVSTPAKVAKSMLRAGFTPASDDQGLTLFTPAELRPPFTPILLEASMQALDHVVRAAEMDVIHDLFRAALPNPVSEALAARRRRPQPPRDIGLKEIEAFYEQLSGAQDHRNPDEAFWDAAQVPFFMDDLIPAQAPLAIFGAGRHGAYVFRCLRRFGREVAYVLDNDAERWGSRFHGLEVRNPADLTPGTFVVIASAWAHEIQAQLQGLGRVQDQDFLVWPTWL